MCIRDRLERVAAEHEDRQVREHAAGIVETIRAKSPTSVKVTLEALRRLEGIEDGDVRDALRQEYRIASHMVRRHDMAEGIRAQLVDKDRNPEWDPATIEEVGDDVVQAHFDTPADGELALG